MTINQSILHLAIHSYYSLRYGVMSPEQLVEEALERGWKKVPLTDINNTSAAYGHVQRCLEKGLQPVLGIDFREGDRFLYLGLARNREGWRQLCELLNQKTLQGGKLPEMAPHCPDCHFVYGRPPKPPGELRENEWIGLRPQDVNTLTVKGWLPYLSKMVAFAPWTFRHASDFNVHRLLRCIDHNCLLSKLKPEQAASPGDIGRSPSSFLEQYSLYPQLVQKSEWLLSDCEISFPPSEPKNKRSFTLSREGDHALLEKLTVSGCKRRYGANHSKAIERLQSELKVIRQLHFSAYFLVTWDIVRYARSVGYFHVGRGSGANSIAAYCLGITDVDPLELDLYFERFINPHRSSPPDFDIDFSWDERDDVTDYIFKRYGKEHTALLATYNTFKGKSIVRELGKVFGLPKADIDLLVEQPNAREKHHPFAHYIFRYADKIAGFPNYLGIHAGGILIAERPLSYFTALQSMPKGFPIVHFDMYEAEEIGFHKYDVLSQRGLGHIKMAVDLIRENTGKEVNVHAIEAIKRDPGVRKQLRSGQCMGCFYIESPAMRGLLHKLRCDNYIHLVAASSIIRPGVAQSGMMREYIERSHQPSLRKYLHPIFEKHLGETYGIMVYQEDVMKIVHHFAGLGLDESDVLRRIMTGKKKQSDTFLQLQKKYFDNCKSRGYSEELSQEVWRQIESFSGYSFCKAHSASFAVESFQSLYLKTYHPLEFMVAVINNFGGFYATEFYVHEARMCGAYIHAPCVNHSRYLTHLDGKDLYIGWVHLHNLDKKTGENIVSERKAHGPFLSLEDFVQRIDIGREQLDLLIRIGAFRFTGLNKYQLMWEKNAVHNPQIKHQGQICLLQEAGTTYPMPALSEGPFDQAFDEMELLGFPLQSPFTLIEKPALSFVQAEQLPVYKGHNIVMLGYFVTSKYLRTSKGEVMNFGTWMDEKGYFFDTVHFPKALALYPLRGQGCYWIRGKVVEDFGFFSLEVSSLEKIPYVRDERY